MRYPLFTLVFGVFAATCFGHVEFVGFTSSEEGMRFVLKDTKENRTSEWLRLEQSFRGFKLVAYDPSRELLTVESEGGRLVMPLRASQVQSALPSKQTADEPKKYKVGNVIIKAAGDGTFSEKIVLDAMQIRSGGTFDAKALDQDIRSIYRTGQFKFVEVRHEPRGPESFNLIVTVIPKSQ